MTYAKHVKCSVCGDKITVRIRDQQEQRLTKRGYAVADIAALSPLCPHCCSRLLRTGQTLEFLRETLVEHKAFLAQAAFHGMLKAGSLDDTQHTALEAAFHEVIRLTREAVLGRDSTSESNSTPELATRDARGLGDDDTNDTGTGNKQ